MPWGRRSGLEAQSCLGWAERLLNRTHREPVVPEAVILRIDTTRIEVQVPGIASGVERSRPVVAIRPAAAPRRTTAAAGASKEKPVAVGLALEVEAQNSVHGQGGAKFALKIEDDDKYKCLINS